MTLNLTTLESTHVTAASAKADLEQKNPKKPTLKAGKSRGTAEHRNLCQGMAQDFNRYL